MVFKTYGDENKPAVMLMHGMCQHWRSMYELMHFLEDRYYLIILGMDGFNEETSDFTTFADQCRQIEEYVQEKYDGKLYGFFGISQGTLVGSELLTRNRIQVEKVYFDGTYVAHQGYLCGKMSAAIFTKAKKNGGHFPKIFNISMKLMGLTEKDLDMLSYVYWGSSDESIRRNMMQNYTYHLRPEIANTNSKIWLCCGSKERYAKKSHKMLKQYIIPVNEEILDGYGHGELFYRHSEDLCNKIVMAWEGTLDEQ